MNPTCFALIVGSVLLGTSARAQDPSAPAGALPPSSPPQVVTAPAAPAPGAINAPLSENSGSSMRITQTVYTPNLPSPQELTDAAAAQGLTVERITQTSLQLIAFYRTASGQPLTVAYQSLPPAGVSQPSQPPTVISTAPPPVVVSAPPTVVYQTAPRVIYYETSPYYYPSYYAPRYWYPPVSLSFGFGYRGGYSHRYRR